MEIILVFLFSFIVIGYIGSTLESKNFNNGICPECKTKYKYFDMDSQGGRGYVCENSHYTWVSYPWVDRNK